MATITWACLECGTESRKPIDARDDISARALIRQLREDFDRGENLFHCAVGECGGKMYPVRIEGIQ
ncbi:hypothetical protein [Microbulbifer thermotolerans]|uniref:Uncharacterized protein n=1 Tax=Microbulbifer thermotolerans TaxID=252514 RepID=A0A143HLN8_MICTH|nr:hypothetical protein [Microbulbifer thermotolerans]AMX02603.1 hypothetical protein A3224_08430 [Microbulbifer thermotolerans]MCX2779751.1 hypothetical protein [Microbulbifer thermotolerans]MCX2782317.1 hypothetical protein [Microbulbifer thermotolerans]MCX2794906.1 hypothetical protein [Microbulbifer thermotolerans]MCX2800470.1 hypothetical protein [Microbulbifer thermotolerans]